MTPQWRLDAAKARWWNRTKHPAYSRPRLFYLEVLAPRQRYLRRMRDWIAQRPRLHESR
jgi:hypothetical protein